MPVLGKQQPPQPSRYSSNALSSSQELEKVAHPTANGNGHVQGEEESSSKGLASRRKRRLPHPRTVLTELEACVYIVIVLESFSDDVE